MSALWKGWAVKLRTSRNADWSLPHFCGRTRSAAIDAYNEGIPTHADIRYEKRKRKHLAVCVRVELREVTP